MAIEPVAGEDRQEAQQRRVTALLITGRPGIGKTTIVRRVAGRLERRPGGFYTEEVRERGERRGFRAVTFDGAARPIADVDFKGMPRVGRYGVDVSAIDHLAETALRPRAATQVFIIDEIGRMECLSDRFVEAVQALLDSGRLVVATVGQKGTGFIAGVKRRRDVELWEATSKTRDGMPDRVLAWIERRTVL